MSPMNQPRAKRPPFVKLHLSFAIAMAMTTSAYAAEKPPVAADDDNVEHVEVTGSRIKGVDLEGANPVISVSRDAIDKSGYTSIAEFLKDLPQTSSAGSFSSAGGLASGTRGQPAGTAGVSLRGLGSASTLVLVNGRRVAISSFANEFDSFVDINAIPMAAVERIEVLTDGASSIYGSDAVAGVINFILRKDYEGTEISGMVGDDTRSDDYLRTDFNVVHGFSTENSHTTLVFDYYKRNALFNRDRPINVTFKDYNQVSVDDARTVEPYCAPEDITRGGTRCTYDYVSYRPIDPESRRLGFLGQHDYTISNTLSFFAEAMYQRIDAKAYENPGRYNATIAGDHPGTPASITALNLQDGSLDPVTLRTRLPETKTQDSQTDSYRVLGGLRGDLGGSWSWESALTYARSESTIELTRGYYNADKFDAALNGELCANGAITCTPASGGLYFYPYNLGRDTPADVLALLRERAPREGLSEMTSWDVQFNGDIFELPAGTVQLATGMEYRDEEISDKPADIVVEGGVLGLGSTAAEGARSQYALYAELHVPLTETLDAQLALRYDHYNDFGGDTNPKLGLRWRASDDLVLRGSWATAFRAPSLVQIGAGRSEGDAFLDCNSYGGQYAGYCAPGEDEVQFTQVTFGNKDLGPENSRSYNLGGSWNITDALQVTLDYWNYHYEDIVDVDFTQTLNACQSGSAPQVGEGELESDAFGCEVASDGTLVLLQTGFFNVGEEDTDGVDLTVNYQLDGGSWGNYKFHFSAEQVFSFDRKVNPESPSEDLLGRLSGANEIGRPELLANVGVDWSYDRLSASLSANYTDSVEDGDFWDPSLNPDGEVASWTVWNGSIGYDLTEKDRLLLAVNNLFDREPPFASSPTNGYASSIHDFFGRVATLRYTHTF